MNLIIACLLLIGTGLVLVAAIGIVRMPDFYIRTQATGKAATVGTMLIHLSVVLYMESWEAAFKSVGIMFLILLSTPITTHAFGRAAKARRIPLEKAAVVDQFPKQHTLLS
ncbi:MAG: monovalent cation/H(+) antiporter subunit G [Oligoflexus sp.]